MSATNNGDRSSGEFKAAKAQETGESNDILQQLSDSFQSFLFGKEPIVKSPSATSSSSLATSPVLSSTNNTASSISNNNNTNNNNTNSNNNNNTNNNNNNTNSNNTPKQAIPQLKLNHSGSSSEEQQDASFNSKMLYEAEMLKLTLEEQLRQVDQKLAQPSNTDDPISQIKVWFEMRQLKANLENQLKEVELNIKKLSSDEPAEQSPWDDFVSFLISPSNSVTSSNNSSVTVSDNEGSDSEHVEKRKQALKEKEEEVQSPPVPTIPVPIETSVVVPPLVFPAHAGIHVIAHVDCKDYYEALAKAIEGATREIFLTCWFLTPELYLIRDPFPNPAYRLDYLLQRKAKEGVQVYIILWDETKIAVFKGSKRAQEMLATHPNIHVIRHPPFTPIYWSHHQKLVVIDQEIGFVGGVDLCFGRYDTSAHPLADSLVNMDPNAPPSHTHCIWPGKDYYNPTISDGMGDITRPFEDSLDRKVAPRMPWHDAMLQVDGEMALDVAKNFISRWNHHREWNENQPLISWGLSESQLSPRLNLPPDYSQSPEVKGSGTCTCQLLRSIGEWSGSAVLEATIHQAYLEAIEDSEHYIYIENQNFVSVTAGGGVKNTVAFEIIRRIKRAIRKKEAFRVYIMIPLTPDGKIEQEQTMRSLMQWQYLTISRGGTSIIEQLRKDCPDVDPFDYISVYSLRTHGVLPPDNLVVTEQIYVHSKLMIVDDRVVIVGSNNINDRSLLGDRDSELAIIVRDDTEKVTIQMNGVPYTANKFAHDLRVRLFSEYLGISNVHPVDNPIENASVNTHLPIDLIDPVSTTFYRDTWMAVATGNTKIYEHVFPDIPRDSIQTFEDYNSRPSLPNDTNLLEEVRGFLVLHPLYFLEKENLGPTIFEAMSLWDELFQ